MVMNLLTIMGIVISWKKQKKYSRLKIGASADQIQLMLKLSSCLDAPYFCLYVLVTPRDGSMKAGRYQSPPIESREVLADFLLKFREALQTDGRHHIWVGNAANEGLIVYDKHNVIYAYGPIDKYLSTLHAYGHKAGVVDIPYPHSHSFRSENDEAIRNLLTYWDWQYFPLVASEDQEYADE